MKKLLLAGLLLLASPTQAAITGYYLLGNFNIATDSSSLPFDSVAVAVVKSRADSTANGQDSATVYMDYWAGDSVYYPRPLVRGHLVRDSLTWTMDLPVSRFDPAFFPAVEFLAFPANGGIVRAQVNMSAIAEFFASVQEDTLAAVHGTTSWTTGGAAGSGPNDDTILVIDTAGGGRVIVEGAQFIIRSNPGGVEETDWLITDVVGRKLTKLAAADWDVYVNAPMFFQEDGFQTITNAGDQLDSIWVYSVSVTALPGVDSCVVFIFTDVPFSEAKIVSHGSARDDKGKPIRNVEGTWLDPTEIRPRPKADANGVIQVILAKADSTLPISSYDIEILNKFGERMVWIEDYKVPNQTQDTLIEVD